MLKTSTFFLFVFMLLLSYTQTLAQATTDPTSLPVYQTTIPLTIDGVLSEADWSVDKPRLMFRFNGTPSGNNYTPTNSGLVVKPPYTDTSTCYVRFLHNGMDLYISLWSNDHQVCKFDWEGDGLFLVLKNASNLKSEFHLYVINSTTFGAETGGAAPIPAGGYGGVGVVDGTIYDSTDVDNGYTAEGVIHLDSLGYTTMPSSIQVAVIIFDPDNILPAQPWGEHGNYAKQWWGSEWGDPDPAGFRTLNLLTEVVPVELTSFTALVENNGVRLTWITATELNNSGFDIERSNDNVTFEKIGFTKGNGSTSNFSSYSYFDQEATGKLYYRLKQIDFNGTFKYSNPVEVDASKLVKFELSQNYPNPFNPTTLINYTIPQNSFVTIRIFDVLGNQVALLLNNEVEAGAHQVNFNASNLSSGVYYYSINVGNFNDTKKLLLIK